MENGKMEGWKDGRMGIPGEHKAISVTVSLSNIPTFHFSTIPIFQFPNTPLSRISLSLNFPVITFLPVFYDDPDPGQFVADII